MALQILTLGFCDGVETFIRKCHCFESDSLGGRAASAKRMTRVLVPERHGCNLRFVGF